MQKLINWYKTLLPKYLLAAVLIIVPLFPKFPLFSIPGTYVAIRFEDLILLLLGIVTLIKILSNFKFYLKDKLIIAFVIFFSINLVSVISGIFITKTVVFHIGLLNYFRRIEYLIPFFAVLTLFTKEQIKENLNYYIKILLIVVFVSFVYGLGQRYLAFPIIITQNDTYAKGVALRWTVGSHINSTFAGHYDLAAFMVLVLPILISLFFILKEKWNKLWLLIPVLSGLWLLVNSLSRISQVAYLVAVSVALFLARKFKPLVFVIIISIILIGASSSLNARFARIIDVLYEKIKIGNPISQMLDITVKAETQVPKLLKSNVPVPVATPVPVFEDRSTSIRLKVEWPRAIRAFKINPLLGTGYSSISLATDNDYLRMLGETGILGFMAFALIFARIGKLFVKVIPKLNQMTGVEHGFVVGVIGGVIGIFISSFFIDLFEASKLATLLWLMIGYVVYLIRSYVNE